MLQDAAPERDPLAKADTQPKTFLFIPIDLAWFFIIVFFIIGSEFHILFMHALFILPLWVAAAILVRRDLNGIRVFNTKIKLSALYLDAPRWQGGLSPSPWPSKRSKEPVRYAI